MAAKVLTGESNISEMPIEYAPQFTKVFNTRVASALDMEMPEGYTQIGE